MNKFSTSSKPKVLYCGKNVIKVDSIELLSISYEDLSMSLINQLNPDLIITDTANIGWLRVAPYSIRKKWILYDKSIYLHGAAVYSSLIPDNKLISVFTSIYNTGYKLLETYKSLCSQIYTNWEWVIVDDSTESQSNVLKDILNDPRVKYYKFESNSSGNIGEAKYRAAMLCSGIYLVELDHDDILTPDCLYYVNKAFEYNSEVGFVYSDCVEYDMDRNISMEYTKGFAFGLEEHYTCGKYKPYTVAPLNPLSIRHIISVPNHVRAWKSDLYRMIGGHNRNMRIADDYELIVRSFLHTKFMYIPRMLYIQRYDGNNSQNQGSNRDDIQRRVHEIAKFYDTKITSRFNELGVPDICSKMSAIDAYKCIDYSKLVNCNEVYPHVSDRNFEFIL